MTELLVPLLLTFISLYALIRKQDVYALLLSGLAMQMAGNSRPASSADSSI